MIRDAQVCGICLGRADTINHRANRGHGGYQAANRPSNGGAICWLCNGKIEDDTPERKLAILRGMKISRDDDPEQMPYFSPLFRVYVWIRDDWSMDFLTDAEITWWLTMNEAASTLRGDGLNTGIRFNLERGKEPQ